MTGHSTVRRLIGALAVALALASVLTSCGERASITATRPGPAMPLPPVAQITVPPGATEALPEVFPTPRVSEAIVAVPPVVVVVEPPDAPKSPTTEKPLRPAPTPVVTLTGAAKEGREQFTAMGCVACHKSDLSGDIGPKLAARTQQDLTDDRIHQQIMHGGNGMPSFPDTTKQEVQNFIALIRSYI